MTKPRILIIGAGLGGLTAGISLAQRGFVVNVFEAAAELGEVGAGLTVSRSAQAVFADIGLLDRVRETCSVTSRMAFLHYRTGRMLAGAVDDSDGRWTPDKPEGGIHIHRADLHALLVARFTEVAPDCLHLGKRLVDVVDTNQTVTATFADGTRAQADLLIGADGIRSAVREKLCGEGNPRFTGQLAYRFMVDGDKAAPFLREAGRAAVFLGPGRVFNRYTLRGGATVNCVAITQSDQWTGEGWSTPAEIGEMLALYEGWHPDVTALMALASPQHLIKWALFGRASLPVWRQGNVSLLGDAAHPMLPFLGLGAAMAIEDAMVLARALEAAPGTAGLDIYETTRRGRVERIAELSRIQGEISQASDPDHYEPKSAPAQDKSIQEYDPVTTPLALENAA
jgi:salicylate hydroxylase